MCGIAGWTGQTGDPGTARQTLERMIGAVRHRGPDGLGFRVEPDVALAHARLSIIDVSGGDQPIRNEDGSVWVVFNGEIFNYVELRADLEARGHRFYTRSDTEVIVHLYEEHGTGFVGHLNGQFAIALWDARERQLVLARDRAGIRPLYYAVKDDRLWFGSEIKALLATVPALRRLDVLGVAQALTYWGPVDPQTAFAGVRSLPPGSLLVQRPGEQAPRIHTYWDWTFPPRDELRTRPFDDCVEELRELLTDAVRLQLRSDVPVGAYLSGGLDSAGLTTIIRRLESAPLRTFSIAFDDAEFDESREQAQMVRFLGTDHTTIRCEPADIGRAFPRFVHHAEAPVVRTAPVPLMLLSGAVREHGYKVVLTGEGADEVFAGYDIFKEARIRRFMARQPDSAVRPQLLRRLYPYLKNSPVRNAEFGRQFFGQGMDATGANVFAHLPRWNTSRRALAFLSDDARAELGAFDPAAWYEAHTPPTLARCTPLARDQYVEAHTLLAGYLLSSQGDRVAMANSVEGRVPYLDHRVIEFAAALPDRYKLRGLREKHILREALSPWLPPDITRRVKQPYRAPDSRSFFVDGRPLEFVADLLAPARVRDAGYFEPNAVARLVEKCRTGRAVGFGDNQAFVGLLSTMLLDELFVRDQRLTSLSAA